MPDIDLDFRDDRRADVLGYTVNKYGSDKVAQIITFGTLGARAALRDVGRVMDIPLPEVDRVAKIIPNIPSKAFPLRDIIAAGFEGLPDLKEAYQSADHLRELIDTAARMEGVVRNAGTHAAGVVISAPRVLEYRHLRGHSLFEGETNRVSQRLHRRRRAVHVRRGFGGVADRSLRAEINRRRSDRAPRCRAAAKPANIIRPR